MRTSRERDRAVLEVDGLEVRYGAVAAVRGLSLEVAEGEIVGLIGPNGAGKSTTLHAIMGALPLAGGDVRLRGRFAARPAPGGRSRAPGIALVPEGRRIFGELTVEENLRLGLAARRARRSAAARPRRCLRAVSRRAASSAAGRPGRSPAASSSSSRSRGRSSPARGCSSSTSPRSGSPRRSWTSSSRRSARSAGAGVTVLLVEQRAQRTVALRRPHVPVSNGELRLALGPADADDTDRLVAAYLS